jgi:hypothetical protein
LNKVFDKYVSRPPEIPTYSYSLYSLPRTEHKSEWTTVSEDPRKPLLNKPIVSRTEKIYIILT